MKVSWRRVAVTRELMDGLEAATGLSTVMIHTDSRIRGCRKSLRPHRDRQGRYYVMVGARGHDRRYLAPIAEWIVLDGSPTVLQFWFDGDQPKPVEAA